MMKHCQKKAVFYESMHISDHQEAYMQLCEGYKSSWRGRNVTTSVWRPVENQAFGLYNHEKRRARAISEERREGWLLLAEEERHMKAILFSLLYSTLFCNLKLYLWSYTMKKIFGVYMKYSIWLSAYQNINISEKLLVRRKWEKLLVQKENTCISSSGCYVSEKLCGMAYL